MKELIINIKMGKGRSLCCDKKNVKRGGWTTEEDLRLTSYIQKHGHTNWRALPTLAGLMRCGKSCRLRWINYLRPDVKRGNFTPQEELTIINLHNSFGNKWSKIASYLPGRTDNEIKNVWNTHLKKRLNNPNLVHKDYSGNSASPSYTSSSITFEDQNVQNALDVVQEPDIHCPNPNPNEKSEFLQIDSSHPSQDHKENPTSYSRPSDSPATNRAADDGRIEIPVDSEIDIWELFDSLENEEHNLQEGYNVEWFRFLEDEVGLANDEIDYFPTWPSSPLNL